MTFPSGQPAPPGYYPDPAGSGLLRWWHGSAWTDDLAQPAPPMAPFGSVSFDSSAPAYSTFGTSVVPPNASASPRRSPLVMVISAVLVLCVGFAAYAVKQSSAHDSKGGVPVGITAGPTESSRPAGSPLVTPGEANAVLQKYWPIHEQALVSRDSAALRRLDTGAMAAYEPNAVFCGCMVTSKTARPLLNTSFFVPRQTTYPAFFAVTSQTSSYWTEVLVFTKKSAGKPWLVSEDSGFLSPLNNPRYIEAPAVDTDGYASGPNAAEHVRATRVAAQLARFWQRIKVDGAVPAQHTFEVSEQLQTRLDRMAAHKDGAVQGNGLRARFSFFVDPHDPLVEFATPTTDLACQAIREKVVYYGATATDLVLQDPAQHNWGPALRPGVYRSIVSRDAWQTCFIIPHDASQPIQVLNQDVGGNAISLH